MVPGTSVKSSKEALRLTRLYPGAIYSTAGMCEWSFEAWCFVTFTNKIIALHYRYSSTWCEIDCRRTRELARVWIDCKSTGMRCHWTVWPWLSTWLLRTTCAENNIRKATAIGHYTSQTGSNSRTICPHRRFGYINEVLCTCEFTSIRDRIIDKMLLLLFGFHRFPNITQIVIRGFMGTTEEAMTYLDRGYYLGFTGYLCKVKLN